MLAVTNNNINRLAVSLFLARTLFPSSTWRQHDPPKRPFKKNHTAPRPSDDILHSHRRENLKPYSLEGYRYVNLLDLYLLANCIYL
jgi:hypothetical protein